MKERGGISVAAWLLLLCICECSDIQSLSRLSENGQSIYSAGDFGSNEGREARESIADLQRQAGLTAPEGGGGGRSHTWRERGAGTALGSAGGRGDSNKHLSVDVASGDRPAADQAGPAAARARPAGAPAETVLGFETVGVQVPGKDAAKSGARAPGQKNSAGAAQQTAHGAVRSSRPGPVAPTAGHLGRQDVSAEVDTDSAGARGSDHPPEPAERTSQSRLGQDRGGAVAGGSGGPAGRQRPSGPPRQPGRPAAAKQEARVGPASDPRDSISVSAEIDEDQHTARGGLGRPGQATAEGGPTRSSFSEQQGQQQRQQDVDQTEWLPESIPGQSGVDYPVLNRVPQSEFDCHSQDADGFYADTSGESKCQAFWVCHNDQKDGFLCPNGTVFNQRYFACDWWFNVRCQDSPQYYNLNRNIGVLGTRLDSQPPAAAGGVHPVLTLLRDILQYPRVPPVLPPDSAGAVDIGIPIHSAAQPGLPSRNQYSDDAFHALDRSSVHVSGGVPGLPPTERHSAGQPSRPAHHEAVSTAVKVSDGQEQMTRRHVKRNTKRTPQDHSMRHSKRRRGSRHLHERKAREHTLIEQTGKAESAASALSAQISQVGQSVISQPKKRTADPASGGAYTSVQDGTMADGPAAAGAGLSGPLLQTVDKVAFPTDVTGPDFPKVEEDFNIQETSGVRKSTSIKDVLPSHIDIPHPGAVKVMAASGSQQNGDANSGPQNPAGNQASITDLSEKENTGVPGNYAGISLVEDVQLDKNVHGQASGAMSDTESMSGNYGQGHGVSLKEDVEFDKKNSAQTPIPAEVPQTRSDPRGMSVLESVAGDNGRRPGVSVQENVQVDQKRDAPPPGSHQPPSVMPQSPNPSTSSSNPGGNNGPAVSMTENVKVDNKNVGHSDVSGSSPQAVPQSPSNSLGGTAPGHGPGVSMTEDVKIDHKNGSPASSQNQSPGGDNGTPGGAGDGPGLSLTEDVQIAHKGNGPQDVPSQAPPAVTSQDKVGGPATAGNEQGGIGPGPADQPGSENGAHSKGQMEVEGFLMDQRGGGTPAPTPPPSSGIRSEESVQVNFDDTSQDQHQEGAPANLPQAQSNQPQSPHSQTPPESASNSDPPDRQPNGANAAQEPRLEQPHPGDDGSGIKIPPNSEQVLEEQSNVKILIPYDGQGGGGNVPSGSKTFTDPIGNFGLSNQVNSGLALGNSGTHSIAKGRQQEQVQNQPQGQPQGKSQGQPQGQLQDQSQGQLPGQQSRQLHGQQPQGNTADLLRGGWPQATGSAMNNGPAPSQPAPGRNDVKIAEDVSVRREPSAGAGPLADSPAGGPSRPGYMHAGDARMNASAMTIPKKEGSSKILEQLDARSQFASNVGDEPGMVKTHVQMQEEKLGEKPGTSDLFDDPSALKREMPSENVKISQQQQQTPPPEPQGQIIPGQKNVQITSESVSRIIKNPSRHRSAISDPSGLDLPELLRPPGFGVKYYPYKAYPTLRTVKPVSLATPQPSAARLAGSIDIKSNNEAGGGSPNAQTLTAGISERQSVANSAAVNGMSQPSGPQRIQRGDLSTKLSETLKMVDNILGPPPFKLKRNPQPTPQRDAYLDSMESGHPSSPRGRAQKRASEADLQDGNMGINLTVLIGDQPDGGVSSQAGASVPSRLPAEQGPPAPPPGSPGSDGHAAVQEREKIRIFNSLKDMARSKSKGEKRKKHRLKQTAKETEIKDVIEVKTSAEDDAVDDKTYDYDISQLPGWMKKAVKSHVKSPH